MRTATIATVARTAWCRRLQSSRAAYTTSRSVHRFRQVPSFGSVRTLNTTTTTTTTSAPTRFAPSTVSSRWTGVATTPFSSSLPFRRWLSTSNDNNENDSDSDSDEDFNFDSDDDDDEEEVQPVSVTAMTAEEEAQMTADIHKLVADELEKIEQQSQPVWGNRYGSHVTDRTLTAAESRYVRLGAESPSPKASEKADADLVTEGSEEDVEGEPKEDGAVEGEAGVDKPHGTKVVATRRETPMSPTWYDAGRERRVAKLGKLKRRGKGPPKKGSGKRSK